VVSAALLMAVAAAFLLPWPRLPGWMPVLVPLAYTGSVLALILAAGTTSGVGIVILVPLIWTVLFQEMWESACVVAAILAVEVVISLTPAAVPDAVIARRVILWAALGAVISVSAHGLRDRLHLAREQAARLQDRLREASIIEDRDRIASDLRDKVIQEIFAAGLTLESAAMRTADPDTRRRIDRTIDDLDHAVLILRDTVYGLEHRLEGRGLHAEILRLCEELSLTPELSFTGPVDGALNPGDRARLPLGGCVPGRHPPPGTGPPEYLTGPSIKMIPVARGPCDHARAEVGYHPSRTLRHLIRARNATCTAPGCRRPAARCDLDHTVPWDQGGITCECDLAPPCKR
jgi:hypothetical protein